MVSQIGAKIGGTAGQVILVGWLVSGLGIFLKPVEAFLARALFRLRKPTGAELQRLQEPWTAVLQAAGIKRWNTYSLWIQDTKELNAFASAGHIVAVTRKALDSLPPPQLSAVLAHELGHHLKGAAWAGLLAQWYSVPGKIAMRLATAIIGFVVRVMAHITFSSAVGLVIGTAFFVTFGVIFAMVAPAMLVLFLLIPLAAYLGRLDEFQADRVAAQLGFGSLLISVLQAWLNAGHDDDRQQLKFREMLMASHPPLSRRIIALERQLARGPQ